MNIKTITLIALATISTQVFAQATCEKACPRNVSWVCGSDNKTYANECIFEIAQCKSNNAIQIVSSGKCPSMTTTTTTTATCEKACPRNIEWVCGSDNKSYANRCLLEIAQCKDKSLRLVSHGPCATAATSLRHCHV